MDKNISLKNIDKGNEFNWGKTSSDYAKYRDIYPDEFYNYILNLGLCHKGQSILDVGTGTGVLPRNMYQYGASWVGTDISAEQIAQAKALAEKSGMKIDFSACDAKDITLPDNSFDVITASQCFWYFDHKNTSKKFSDLLRKDGCFLMIIMEWLPFEDEIAGKSEDLILKYNPDWSGCGETFHPISVPSEYMKYFSIEKQEEFLVDVPFTRESWHGRMRACRGTGASMSPEDFEMWNKEHTEMLEGYPNEFKIKHYIAAALLRKK